MCGGDPLKDQKVAAVNSESRLANTMADIAQANQAQQAPFITSRINNGLPYTKAALDYSSGTMARAAAPGRAELNRKMAGYGNDLPSGFKTSQIANYDANVARGFDDSALNVLGMDEASRQAAAGMSSPLPYFGGAQQGYGQVIGAPKIAGNSSFWGGILGGALGGR